MRAIGAAVFITALSGWSVACTEPGPVAIGVALGGTDSDGVRFAYEDAVRAGLGTAIDTLFLSALNNRAAPAIEAAQQLVAAPGMAVVIGHSNSAASLAAAPVYNENQVVQLSPQSTAVLYSHAGPFSFRMVAPDDHQGRFLAQRLMAEPQARRIALIYVNDDYGRGLRAELLKGVAPDSIEWVMDAPHMEPSEEPAITRLVSELTTTRPDLLMWVGRFTELNRMLPAIRAALGPIRIVTSDGASAAVTLARGDPLWAGIRFVDLVDMETPEVRAFGVRYVERFGREPMGAEVLSYDAMSLAIVAVQSGARTGADVQRYLNSLGRGRPAFVGIAGPVMFDVYGNVDRDYVLREMPPSNR